MTEIHEQLKKSIHNTTEAGINDFSGEFLIYEEQETHHSVALDKCILKFDLMINNVVFAIELQGESLPIEEIPEVEDSEEFDAQIEHLAKLNNSIKVLSESRTYLEILRAEMVQEAGRQACKHMKIGTEL